VNSFKTFVALPLLSATARKPVFSRTLQRQAPRNRVLSGVKQAAGGPGASATILRTTSIVLTPIEANVPKQ
jgi:hypothetical protein